MLDVPEAEVDGVEITCRSPFHVAVPGTSGAGARLEALRAASEGWPGNRAQEGVVAFEVKLSPRKTELDRAVGPCVDYAQFWPTLLVVVDTTQSIAAEIERRFVALDCDRVLVIAFAQPDLA